MSAMMGERGEPIGVPYDCRYMTLLKVKNMEFKTNRIPSINLFLGRLVLISKYAHLFETLSIARSIGMFVNSEMTSREINLLSSTNETSVKRLP